MDLKLMNLRQCAIETSTKFIRAQRAYMKAADPNSRKSQMGLKEAAEDHFAATEPYNAALQELREYLLASKPSDEIAEELERTEQLVETLDKEKKVGSKLIEHHAELITKGAS